MALTENDKLDIHLRNKDNGEVGLLLTEVEDLEREIEELNAEIACMKEE